MNAIVFGINGQDGYYLNELLRRHGVSVIGVSRSENSWLCGDVSDFDFVERVVCEAKPTYIFHLAANSTTSHDALFENHATISTGTLNVLEAVNRHSRHTRVFLSGSALQFRNDGAPIREDSAFEASSPYAVARIQSVYAARYYRKQGIKAYVGYFFHHDSPKRSDRHLSMRIVRAVQRISRGELATIPIGNLDTVKEFNFAGDLVEALWELVNQDQVFEAVLGSGKGYPIRRWLETCFSLIGQDWRQYIVPATFKPEFDSLISDPTTITSLGWRPRVDIQELAEMMFRLGK